MRFKLLNLEKIRASDEKEEDLPIKLKDSIKNESILNIINDINTNNHNNNISIEQNSDS